MDILKAIMTQQEDDREALPEADQIQKLKAFMSRKVDFQPGDRLVRNEDGRGQYRFPRKDEVCMVVSVFEKPMLDERGMICHGEIAKVTRDKDANVVAYPVDFRYYQLKPQLA